MHAFVRLGFAVMIVASCAIAGCAGSDGTTQSTPAAKGAAPSIADLAVDKQTIAVGKTEVLKAKLHFDDADGDLDGVEGEVSAKGQSVALAKMPIDAKGQKAGEVVVAVMMATAAAGEADLVLWAVDKNGNASNRLSTTIVAK